MFIRQTKTSSTDETGKAYLTFRLVTSERVAGKVRQRTLLNLGKEFPLPQGLWPQLCARIEQILVGQGSLVTAPEEIEKLAQRYAASLVAAAGQPEESGSVQASGSEYHEVDVASLELVRPRSVGVEHAGLAALDWLGLPGILAEAGFNGRQQAAAIGCVIGRLAAPGSELSTWRWLTGRSALGELMGIDFEAMPLMRLYRASDMLIRHRQKIEASLYSRISELFSLSTTVTLYDLTNTYFEGELAGNTKAKRGHSKEKRSDCPLVTMGLVLDGEGFVRKSRMFAGNVSEASTLAEMLEGLDAPPGALVIMDRGIATEANIAWLIEHRYRYLVVSRERHRQFDMEQAVAHSTASGQTVHIQRLVSEDGTEARLYCHSEARQQKEAAMARRFIEKFETGLTKLAAGLGKPRGTKNRDKLLQRIGRLQEQCHGIGQHYRIELIEDAGDNSMVSGLTWERSAKAGSQLTHPGVYCLRTNELDWDEATLWRTYTMLTDLEAVFRGMKSELGLRPVYHHKEERAEGHLFVTVLAYQAIQVLRRKLKERGVKASWASLREILSVQQRVTATFRQKDGRTLHVRKATAAEPELQKIYDALCLASMPGGVKKMVH